MLTDLRTVPQVLHLQQELQVPSALIVALNGIIVLFVVSSFKLRARLQRWADSLSDRSDTSSEPRPVADPSPDVR